ncbi:hypothetical protein B0A52_08227 [Exophiala mesophila]|uniref:Zn(2)-C6 fungal-type domain-containing protein n=1 Tax=Exophiala mesophila TaxID=212818 RepID=A0A438MWF1_EXOME|nr:hypothetical protein B0A52_08227 [Exophiala mesophila]
MPAPPRQGCLRCEKLGRPCTGYDLERKFLDEGVKVRRKYDGAFQNANSNSTSFSNPNPEPSSNPNSNGHDLPANAMPPYQRTGLASIPTPTSPSQVSSRFLSGILTDNTSPGTQQYSSPSRDQSPKLSNILPPLTPSPALPSAFPANTFKPSPLGNSRYPTFDFLSNSVPSYAATVQPVQPVQPVPQGSPPLALPTAANTLPPFRHDLGRYTDQGQPEPTEHPTAKLLRGQQQYAPSEISLDYSVDDDYFDLDIDMYYANGNNACGFIPGLPVIASDAAEPETDDDFLTSDYASIGGRSASTDGSEGRRKRTEYSQKYLNERTTELTCLTRHFVQAISPWLDLFDLDTYFSRIVPVKAVQNVMLRSAMAAVAANQIGQLIANKAPREDLAHLLPIIDSANVGMQPADWFYKAANYYDRGISYLRIFLQRWLNNPGNDLTSLTGHASRYNALRNFSESTQDSHKNFSSPNKRRRLQEQSHGADMEPLLAAISVLSLYETLDSSTDGWSQHLDGFKALLEAKILPQAMSAPRPRGDPYISMKAGRAAFWNFARADYIAAYVNNSKTRLDTENLTMWRAAGLSVTEQGVLTYGAQTTTNAGLSYLPSDREDSVACSLIWIVLRVMNFIAPQDDQVPPSGVPGSGIRGPRGAPSAGKSIQQRIEKWGQLRQQLQEWYDSLPFTFQPYATMSTTAQSDFEPAEEHKNRFVRLYYSVPLCAAALQLYHFAQILLVLNQPVDEKDAKHLAKRLQMFRKVSEESEHHSRRICGIALGKPPPAVSRQMVHSLYLAGVCFEEDQDRKVVVDLLHNVEKDTGLSTAQRLKDLREQWGWQEEVMEV